MPWRRTIVTPLGVPVAHSPDEAKSSPRESRERPVGVEVAGTPVQGVAGSRRAATADENGA
jgi:hypothetical protein